MKTKALVICAMFSALICISALICFPLPFTPTPVTAQVCVIILAGLFLGRKEAFFSVAVYILLGAVGLPVFAGGRGGFGVLAGATGGFIFGFPFTALIISAIRQIPVPKKFSHISDIAAVTIGMLFLYLCGMTFFAATTAGTFKDAFLMCVLPFIPADVAKSVIALLIYQVAGIQLLQIIKR